MVQAHTINCSNCGNVFSADDLFCPKCGTAKSSSDDGDPLLGKVIGGRYLLLARLGHGGSGTIYRGEHVTLRRKVAVKVLHHELSRDDLAVERFRREATTVGEIDNDHIVQIHDFGRTEDGRLYLAMEFLEGETLDAILARDGRLSVELVVDILIQLGEGLMEAHAMGYVHRDLRPRNLFISVRRGKQNYLKLLDFGLAKLVEAEGGEAASTSLGMTFGDPKYMSPEQARGEPIDRRADIYSMGCIAYEMLIGEPPFAGGRVFDILTRHVESPAPNPKDRRIDIPEWLSATVMRMLAKSADDRFITVFRMVEALREGAKQGTVMSDEVARRIETIPPPSVSQAMERFTDGSAPYSVRPKTQGGFAESAPAGAVSPSPLETAQADKTVPNDGDKTAPVRSLDDGDKTVPTSARDDGDSGDKTERVSDIGKTTVAGVGVSALVEATSGAAQAAQRERTEPSERPDMVEIESQPVRQQSRVAEPVEPSPGETAAQRFDAAVAAATAEAEVRAAEAEKIQKSERAPSEVALASDSGASPAGKKRTSQQGPVSSGLSAAWYADGESIGGDVEMGESQRVRLDHARDVISLNPGATDEIYAHDSGGHFKAAILISIGVLGLVVLAIVLFSGGDEEKPTESANAAKAAIDASSAAAPAPADAAPAVNNAIDAGAAAPDAGKSPVIAQEPTRVTTEPKPDRPKPDRPKPDRPKPDRPKPDRPKPTGEQPIDPFGVKPKPPGGSQPIDPFAGGSTTGPSAEDKGKAQFYAAIGKRELSSGNYGGAATNFNKARKLDPKNADAVAGLGEVALSQSSFASAIRHLKSATRLRGSSRNFTLLGDAYLGAGQKQNAANAFKRALKINANNARARNGYNEATGN